MNLFRLPPQIFRLLLLTVGIVVSYAVARMVLVPPSFGEYGWFRGAALGEIAARPAGYAGMKSCDECHSEILQEFPKHDHRTLKCETCHGPSRAHVDNPDLKPPKPKFADTDCLRCHSTNPARPTWLKQIDALEHFRGDGCTGCHKPHQPKEAP